MNNKNFLINLKDKFEILLDHNTGFLVANKDRIEEPKIQSIHRLTCQETNVYLRILKTLSTEEKKHRDAQNLEIPNNWHDNPVQFAKEALHIDLYPHQKKFCQSKKRVNLLIAGRGAGKSVAACVAAIFFAILNARHLALVVSSGQRMSSDFGAKILELIRESPVRRWVKTISNEQVAFKNESCIKLLPANPDTIRGYHPKTNAVNSGITVILDEACFMEQGNEIRKAVEYAMITTPMDKGKLYIVSSPSTTGSWVYAYAAKAKNGDKNTAVIQCPSTANPNITPQEIERLKQTKNELEFRAEVLGEWVDGAYGMFNGLIEQNTVPPSKHGIPKDADCSLGADLALSYAPAHDRNAIAVVARWWPDNGIDSEARFRLVEMAVLERASDTELRKTVNQLIEKYDIEYAGVEQYQGKSLSEYCQTLGVNTQLINPTASAQRTAFHELHRLLRQKLLELPGNLPEIFFDELKAFEYRREPNGQISFGHPAGMHDDTVYALAWAVYAVQFGPAAEPKKPALPPMIQFVKKW